jgi:TP901 family phage tail tape measure protein
MSKIFTTEFGISATDKASVVFSKFASNVVKSSGKVEGLNNKLGGLLSPLDKIKLNMKGVTDALAGLAIGAGVIAGIKKSVSAFAEQETAINDLEVAMLRADGTYDKNINKIKEMAKAFGGDLPGNTGDYMKMMNVLSQQGITTEKILTGMGEATAYLSVNLKMSAAESAEFIAKLGDATQTASTDMVALADHVQKMKFSGLGHENILGAFKSISSATQMMGKTGLEGAKMMAPLVMMLEETGAQGETAGIALNKVFKATLNSEKIAKINAGMQNPADRLKFSEKGESLGIKNFFEQVRKLSKLTSESRTKVIKELFGDDSNVILALETMINKGYAGYEQLNNKVNAQADMNTRVKKMMTTHVNIWDSALGNATNALAKVGEAFEGDSKKLADYFSKASNFIEDFTNEFPNVTRAIGYATVAMGGFLVVSKIALAITPVEGYAKAFGDLRKSILATEFAIKIMGITSQISWGMVLGPIALIAIAVYLLREQLMAFGGGFFDGLMTSLEPVGKALGVIGSLVGGLIDRFLSLFGVTTQSKDGFASWAEAGKLAGKVVGGAIKGVMTVLTLFIDGLHLAGLIWDRLSGKKIDASMAFPATKALWADTQKATDATKPLNIAPAITPTKTLKMPTFNSSNIKSTSNINNVSNVKNIANLNNVKNTNNINNLLSQNKAVQNKNLMANNNNAVSGKIDININQNGKPSVAALQSNNKNFVLNAKTGSMTA